MFRLLMGSGNENGLLQDAVRAENIADMHKKLIAARDLGFMRSSRETAGHTSSKYPRVDVHLYC